MWVRSVGYRLGWFTSHTVSVPVIVVGNISVGGTGKSPLVQAIVEHLFHLGWQPGIIARGYGGNSPYWPRIVETNDLAAEVGDEPLMLKKRCGRPIAVGSDRVASAQLLIDQCGCDIIISDDGFQHLRLQRDIDIVVIDGERGLGNGWCLPAGPLREKSAGLQRADMIVINGDGSDRNTGLERLRKLHTMRIEGDRLMSLGEDKQIALSALSRKTVHAITGLGNPNRFYQTLREAGLQINCHTFPDHHQFSTNDFEFVKPEDIVVMTEKDAVKCRDLSMPGQCWVLPVVATLAAEFFAELKSKLTPDHHV